MFIGLSLLADERVVDVKTLCTVFSGHTKSVDNESGPFCPVVFNKTKFIYVDASSVQADGQIYEVPSRNSLRTLWSFSGTSFLQGM